MLIVRSRLRSTNNDADTISIVEVDTTLRPVGGTPTDLACGAIGDTATIKFVGPAGSPPTNDDIEIYVLVEDKSGNLSFYGKDVVWQSADAGLEDSDPANDRRKGNFYTSATDQMEVKPTKYFEHNVMVPRATRQGGRNVPQSVTLTVKGEGTVHVYLPDDYEDDIVTDFANDDCSPQCDPGASPATSPPKAIKFDTMQPNANESDGDSGTINITFLGPPSLGEDSDNDRNKILDDFQQCSLGADGEVDTGAGVNETTTDPDGNSATCTAAIGGGADDMLDVGDTPESRSKLVITGSDVDGTKSLIGGKSVTYEMDEAGSVTIYAVLEDANSNALEDMEVSFSSATNPSGIIAERDLADEKDTEAFAGAVDDIDPDDPGDTHDTFDAVAEYTLTGLEKVEGSYTITVDVMVGDVDLGTVIVTRPGIPETLVAGVFNQACFDMNEEVDYSDATFNMTNKDCTTMGDAKRFGAGERIFVKAHLEDSLKNVVGESDVLDSEIANEDDDLLGDADPVTIKNPVENRDEPRAWIYTVDEDATLGDHTITVSTTANNADDEAIDDVTVTVSVAGPPVSLSIIGDTNIESEWLRDLHRHRQGHGKRNPVL